MTLREFFNAIVGWLAVTGLLMIGGLICRTIV